MQNLNGQTFRLWEGQAPYAIGDEPADIPSITLHVPDPAKRTGAAMLVCPGGGYGGLSPSEGPVIGEWLAGLGVFAAVLKYRLAPRYRHPAMITDARRAMRTMRARAEEFQIDPNRLGIFGSSAGGHLAATASTLFEPGDPNASDPVERFSSRPDISVLLYPVMSMYDPTHAGSRSNLLGDTITPELQYLLSPELHVTPQTPPTFIFHTVADPVVPIEGTLMYASALRKVGVPFELHAYERGPHGLSLSQNFPICATWCTLARNWLTLREFVRAD